MKTVALFLLLVASACCFAVEDTNIVKTAVQPDTTPDPIDRLVADFSASNGWLWQNGASPALDLPETASSEQIIQKVFAMTDFGNGLFVTNYTILKIRPVQIQGGAYMAAQVQTDFGKKIVLFTKGGRWSRVYDASQFAASIQTLDPIDRLVADLSASFGLWVNGAFLPIEMPETASPEKLVQKRLEMADFANTRTTNYTIVKIRQVHIKGGLPDDSYTADLVETGIGEKIILFKYEGSATGWWNRVFDADRTNIYLKPPASPKPLSPEARKILDDLNLKAADAAWQAEIDMIERPETRPANLVVSGEASACISVSKEQLAKLGVKVWWNSAAKRYEAEQN